MMKIKIILEEDGEKIAGTEALSFETAEGELGKLERWYKTKIGEKDEKQREDIEREEFMNQGE